MKRNLIFSIIVAILMPLFAISQSIIKGSGVMYTNGAPAHTVAINTDSELAIDTTSGLWWEWNRDNLAWQKAGFRVQRLNISIPPTAAPTDKESEVVINDVDSIYLWRAGAWRHLNPILDNSPTNEIQTYGHSGTSTYTNTLSSGGGSWSITGAGIAVISQTGGAVTVTATEVDGSTTNELQTFASTSDATSHTLTLSNSGGSVTFAEGANITLTTSGTGLDGIVTIAATSGGGTDLSYSGTTSPITLNSNSGTDVTFTEGGIITLTASGSNMTISATEVDGSVTNELQTYGHSGTSTYTNTLSDGGGSWSITGAGIAVISQTGGAITVTATEVDGSTTNELQTLANTSDATSHTATLSNSGGSIQMVEGTGIGLATTGTSLNGIVTITASDASPTNELQVLTNSSDATNHYLVLSDGGGSITLAEGANITLTTSGTGSDGIVTIAATSGGGTDLSYTGTSSPITLNSNTGTDVTFTQGGIVSISASGSNMTISATEVDGSISNELQTYGHSGTSTYTNTLSNGGGSWSITGAGIAVISQTGGAVTVTATEVDGSITNEGILGVGAGSGTSSTLLSNTSGANAVTINAAGILAISESTSSNGGSITLTATEVDGSTTNEIQTYGHSGTSTYTNTLSSGGGSWSITGAGIAVISQTGGAVTVTATEVDGSTTNELQTLANTSDATSHTATLSNSGGSIQMVEGAGIGLATTGTSLNGVVTITASDASPTNELQVLTNSSDATNHYLVLSDGGGSITLAEGANITLTTSGTGLDGVVTIASTGGGGGVAGANYQVQYYDDGDHGADANFNFNPTTKRLVVGTTTPAAVLHARGQNDTNDRVWLGENLSGNDILALYSNGIFKWGDNEAYPQVTQTASANGTVNYTSQGLTFKSNPSATGTDLFAFYHDEEGLTSGNYNIIRQTSTWSPSSGSATYNSIMVDPVINASGGGVITGVNVSPTLTATSSGGYRSFSTNINSDTDRWAFYGGGTAASRLGGTLGVGANPASGFQIYSTGAIRADGGLVSHGVGTTAPSDLSVPQVRLWNTTGDTWYLSSVNSGDFRVESGIGLSLSIDNSIGQVNVANTLKIGSVTGTPTTIIGRDGTGQVGTVTLGSGLTLSGGQLNTTGGGGSGDILQNGNSFGAAFVIGTNDDNTVSLEQNNTVFFTGGTDKNVTLVNSVASTSTATDRLKIQTNSTGTASTNFGSAILFQAENSTTNNTNQSRISSYWKSASNGAEISAIDFQLMQGGGGLATAMSINRSGASTGMLEVGTTTPVQITNNALNNNTSYTIGGTTNPLTIGGFSGTVELYRSTSSTVLPIDFTIEANSTGTAGTGFGTNLLFQGESSTTNGRDMAGIQAVWSTVTDASRSADIVFTTVNSASSPAERVRIAAAGQLSTQSSLKIGAVTGTPTTIIGRDGTGQVGTVTFNKEMNIVSGALNSSGLGTTAPTFTIGSGWGTGASSSITGTDVAGEITVTSGTGSLTPTQWGTINFGSNYANTNYAVHLWPSNLACNDILNYLGFGSTKNIGSCVVGGATAFSSRVSNSTAYKFYYRITQYQ